MDYEISSSTLVSALENIENLNKLEDIKEVRIFTRKEFLQKKGDTTFERELNEVLKYLKNLKMLIIRNTNSSKDENAKFDIDINSGISEHLETLCLEGINLGTVDLDRFFKEHPYIKNVAYLNDCNISEIDFLKSVPDGVTTISLNNNPISAKFADDILRIVSQERFKLDIKGCEEVLCEFEKRGFEFSELLTEHRGKLDGNQFYEAFQKALSSNEYSVRDMQQLSQYIDFFSEKGMQEQRIVHIDSLEEYDEQYIESINLFGSGENVIIVVTPKIAEQLKGKISKDINVRIAIKNASELSVEQLEELQKSYNLKDIKVDDPNQSLDIEQTTPYTIEIYKRCRETIDSLLAGIDLNENPNDPNRDKKIYREVIKRLAIHMIYDHESIKLEEKERENIKEQIKQELDAEEGLDIHQRARKETELEHKYRMKINGEVSKNCRNMQGGLLNNTCVCAGYAEIVRNVFSCCGIDARYVWGCNTIDRKRPSHAWNQIKLDGKWYNMDLTWDRNRIVDGEETMFSLQSDKDFNTQKHPYYAEECKKEKCNETLPVNFEEMWYERKLSNRDGVNYSHYLEQNKNQDINEWHDYCVYHRVQDFDNKIFEYGLHAQRDTTEPYLKYVGERLGEEYARGAKGEKAELAKQFAILEVQGIKGDFQDLYNSEESNGHDNPKLLLQLEKVNGLNIEEFEDVIGLDTSALHQDIFVATYEIEEWDETSQRNVMKPIKEYYQRNEDGVFDIIGAGTEYETTFVIDGVSINVDTCKVLQGDSLEKVTQREMSDRLIKNGIEDSLKSGKVTEVAQLTDMSFLKNFRKQCGIPESWDLIDRTFIVSTINEKGEEDFDIIIRNDGTRDKEYEHLFGINATDKSGREMYTTTGRQIPGGGDELDKTQTLKEFMTKSGHRYAITRNSEGKLGFNEIFRENENIIQGQHIDAYTYSTDDLVSAYENAGINQEDLNNAYEILNRTKAERGQTHNQTKTNNFEGR